MSSSFQLVLASGSPRRKTLLEQINCTFLVDVSAVEEVIESDLSPIQVAESLARQKAEDVAKRHTNVCVIGADTIVVKDEEILGKPEDRTHAIQLLQQLSDRTHEAITGVCLILVDKDSTLSKVHTFHARTRVTFGKLSESEIEEYVNTGSPMDKAGGYGIQDDWGSLFVKEIHGDYNNVVGFPLYHFYQTMKSFAPELLPHPVQSTERNL